MPHGTEQHLEHAEHAQHAAHDPFDKRVAMTMAMVAAALAAVTMLSHRAHNETLQYQIKANDNITEASNQWAYYQAKKNRQYLYEADAQLLSVVAKDPGGAEAPQKAEKFIAYWEEKAKEYKEDTKEIENKARALQAQADEYQKKAVEIHHRGDRYDLAELAVEMALILCSVAVLSKQRPFWYTGIGFGVVGIVVALSGFLGLFLPH